MSEKRNPLLSDATIADHFMYGPLLQDAEQAFVSGARHARQFYEDLITTGRLRVVEKVEWDRKKPGCAKCGHPWSMLLTTSVCCPGCGNKIKRP